MTETKEKEKVTLRSNPGQFIKNGLKGIAHFIWNPTEKMFINRTFLSWGYLGVMYTIFYSLLGLFGWAMVAILGAIVLAQGQLPWYRGPNTPLYAATGALNPGMGVRPSIGLTNIPLISNNMDFTQTMQLILADYAERLPYNYNCTQNMTSQMNMSCVYDLAKYMRDINCTQSNNYGYSDNNRPCVLTKLNNLIGWMPGAVKYPPATEWNGNKKCANGTNILGSLMNSTVLNSTSFVYITCTGQTTADTNAIQSIVFNSPLNAMLNSNDPLNNCIAGIPYYYFPFYNQPYYMQPKVVVKLQATSNQPVSVQCSAWNTAINQDVKNNYGVVQFIVQF